MVITVVNHYQLRVQVLWTNLPVPQPLSCLHYNFASLTILQLFFYELFHNKAPSASVSDCGFHCTSRLTFIFWCICNFLFPAKQDKYCQTFPAMRNNSLYKGHNCQKVALSIIKFRNRSEYSLTYKLNPTLVKLNMHMTYYISWK